MVRKYVAFDIETAADIPGPEFNWRDHRPLGITCAAALASDAADPIIWHGKSPDGNPAKQLSQAEAHRIVDHLRDMARGGYTLLTWNGLGFDFDVLAEEADALEPCRDSLSADRSAGWLDCRPIMNPCQTNGKEIRCL